MNIRYSTWLKGGLMSAAALIGLSACSDDHFDLSSDTATTTLWENIEANPQLDSLKMILEKTTVTVSDYDTKGTIKYSGLLNSAQTFTLWAPENGTYNAARWLQLLDAGQNSTVEKQFVRNHLARYNYNGANGDSARVTMLNSKVNVYSPVAKTFRGVQIDGSLISASNGSMHLLAGQADYLSNLYESLEFTSNVDSLYEFLHADDTLIFSASSSTPGATVDGEVQYVDSVFYRSNTVVGNMSLWQNEDSLLLAVVPTNEAWTNAKEKVSKYFKYKNAYIYKDDGSTRIQRTYLNPDSMADIKTKAAIINNMVFSLYKQPDYKVAETSLDYAKNWVANADSIVRGGASSLSQPNVHQPYFQKIIDGVEPYEVSNGYVYPVTSYNYTPSKFWHKTIRIEAEYSSSQNVNGFSSAGKTSANSTTYGTPVYLTSSNRNDSIKGTISNDAYRIFNGLNSASQPTISFKLTEVLSGKYDIYAVMVPLNAASPNQATANTKRNRFTAKLTYDYNETTGRDIAQNALDAAGKTAYFETRAGVVDSVLLFKDFEFPYAFDGVPNSTPMLELKTSIRTADQRANFDYALYVDCILLVSKDDE